MSKQTEYAARLRRQLIDAYGGRCACCGETEFEFLQLDHINGGGRAHRRELKTNGVAVWRLVRNEGFPADKYRLLCANCNFVTRHGRICPHERRRQIENPLTNQGVKPLI